MGSGTHHVGLGSQHIMIKGDWFHPLSTTIRQRGHYPRRTKARLISDTDRSHNTSTTVHQNWNDWNIMAPRRQQPRRLQRINKGVEGQEGSSKGHQPRRFSTHSSSRQARKAPTTMVWSVHCSKHDQTRYISLMNDGVKIDHTWNTDNTRRSYP